MTVNAQPQEAADEIERLRKQVEHLTPYVGAFLREEARADKLGGEIDDLRASILPQTALRAAAERVCWFDWSDNDMDARAAIDALRRAVTDTRPDRSPPDEWEALRGAAPNATGDLSSEEFIRQQRDEWDGPDVQKAQP